MPKAPVARRVRGCGRGGPVEEGAVQLDLNTAEVLPPNARRAHLDGAFLYPRQGYGSFCARLAARLPTDRLHAAHEVVGLDCHGGAICAVRLGGRPLSGRHAWPMMHIYLSLLFI
jgi:hypothetical protein